MGFLDRFQGNKTDPMAEVSANAVAHLREQNLKFQKFMLDKVQDLEEKVAMGQQRLSEPDADDADFGDTDSIGSDFNDYVVDTEAQPAGEEDVRISLEAGVPLTEVAEQAPVEAERTPEPASLGPEPQPEPEQAPEEEAGPPNWEALFGVGTVMPGAASVATDVDVETESETSETALNEVEPDSEAHQPASEAAEPESHATGPAKTASETAENVPPAETVPQEVIMPQEGTAVQPQENTAAQEPPSGGGSLLWDWRSLSTQDTDDSSSEQPSTDIDPAWEPEAAEEVAAVEEDTQEADEQFILLGDAQEQGDMVEIPLPDELGEFS